MQDDDHTQRIASTPMAPYINLMKGMTREEKQIVVTFLTELWKIMHLHARDRKQQPNELMKRGRTNY